jgi:hypothetical protein
VYTAVEDTLVDTVGRLVEEGRVADHHLVREHATGPPVRRLAMSVGLDDLRSEIFGCAAESPRTVVDNFCEAKVREAEVAAGVEEQVFGFEIAIDDVEGVEVAEGEDDDREIEAGDVWSEAADTAEVGEELATGDIGKEHVDIQVVLEGGIEVDDERVVDAAKDVALCLDMFDLAQTDDLRLAEDLECEACVTVGCAGRPVMDEEDASKGACAERALELKVGEPEVAAEMIWLVVEDAEGTVGRGRFWEVSVVDGHAGWREGDTVVREIAFFGWVG